MCLLPAAVGDKTTIMFDSGVRGASDVFKALALGAKFVFVGRLWVWGLSIMGEHGVRHVMKSLLADLDILMNVGGFQRVEQIDPTALGELLHCSNLGSENTDGFQNHRQQATTWRRPSPSCKCCGSRMTWHWQ